MSQPPRLCLMQHATLFLSLFQMENTLISPSYFVSVWIICIINYPWILRDVLQKTDSYCIHHIILKDLGNGTSGRPHSKWPAREPGTCTISYPLSVSEPLNIMRYHFCDHPTLYKKVEFKKGTLSLWA